MAFETSADGSTKRIFIQLSGLNGFVPIAARFIGSTYAQIQNATLGGSDKEWTAVDLNPSSPYYHRVYVTWTRFLQDDAD